MLGAGAKCITNLIPKIEKAELPHSLVEKIFRLFMCVKGIRVRRQLAEGLQTALKGIINNKVLDLLTNLNQLKRGLADLELDCDKAISAL